MQKPEIIERLEKARVLGAINIVFDIVRISGLSESGYSTEAYVEDVLSLFKNVAKGKTSLEKHIPACEKIFFKLGIAYENLLPEGWMLENPHAINKVLADLSLEETIGSFLMGLNFVPNTNIKADVLMALDNAVFFVSLFLANRDYQRALEICEEVLSMDETKELETKCKLLQARIFERAGKPEKALALLQAMQFSNKEVFLKIIVAFYMFVFRRVRGDHHAIKFFQDEWGDFWKTDLSEECA